MSEGASGVPKTPKAIIEHDDISEKRERVDFGDHGTVDGESTKAHSSGFHDATIGFFEGLGRVAWSYADAHPHATLYGIVGFVLAVLILAIGLWDTIVIAVFVTVGTIIGQMVDGDNALVNFIGRIINGR